MHPVELTALEQLECYRDYRHGLARRDRLCESVQGLIRKLAYEALACGHNHNAGVEVDDLVQEAQFAFLDALRWFDESKGYQFTTYLADCVRRRLGRYLSDPKKKPLPQELPNSSGESPIDSLPSADPATVGRVADLLASLSPAEQLLFAVRYGLGGLSPSHVLDAARSLGVPQSFVRTIESSGVGKLRDGTPEPSAN